VISAQPLASSSLAPVVPQQADASASPAVSKKAKKATKAKKGKQHIAVEPSNDAKESEDEQETQGSQPVASTSAGRDAVEDNLQDSDEADGSELDLMHESLKPGYKKGKEKASKVKYVPPGETSAYRDRRTVFIGNLPIEVAKSKVSSSIPGNAY
jgi:nucleolar protein 12